ncbi:hypothetical protein AgCh_025093 [Apium graveolens]
MANSPDHQEEEIPTQDPEVNPETTMMSRLAQLLQQPVAPKDDKKAQYASYYLKDEASFWWESSKALLEGKDLTWERFTEIFLEKYLPSYMQDQMEMKFLDLRQEDMSVAEYEVKFSELSRFVPEYMNTEEKKAKREGEREVVRRENEGRKRKFESSEQEQEQGSSKFRGKFGKNGGGQNQKFQKFKPGDGAQKNRFQKAGQPGKDNRPQIQECKNCGKRHP